MTHKHHTEGGRDKDTKCPIRIIWQREERLIFELFLLQKLGTTGPMILDLEGNFEII